MASGRVIVCYQKQKNISRLPLLENIMKNLRIIILQLLLLCIPIGLVNAELKATWVRTGVVLETETKIESTTNFQVIAVQQSTNPEKVATKIIDEKRVHLNFQWQPSKKYRFSIGKNTTELSSPLKPSPYLIRTVELDGLLSLIENLRQPAKPTAIAFGHGTDKQYLAIATDRGHLAIVDPISGNNVWQKRISEGYVKHIAFSADNSLLYIGEQAADGFIYCYDLTAANPKLRWKYRTADDIETSTPSNPESVYAWVSYPGTSCMQTLQNGDLLVAAVHSWSKNGIPQRRSMLYRFDTKGGIIWKYPKDKAMQKIIRWFDVSDDGKTLVCVVDESGNGNGTLTVLDVDTGSEKWQSEVKPLSPYYKGVTFWRGVSMTPNGKFINVTTDDGRAFIYDVNKSVPKWKQNLATPLEVSGVPIIATTGTIGATNTYALFVTGDTYIPYHLQKGAQRPSALHPNGMTMFAYFWTGEKVWQWKLENMPQGLRIDSKGQYAALAVSKRSQNPNESLHGISVFDLTADGSGLKKYLYTYRTEGQLPYDTLAISHDGSLIAIIETPIAMPDETLRGKNRVHVLY